MNDKVALQIQHSRLSSKGRELNLRECGIRVFSDEIICSINEELPNLEHLILNKNQIYAISPKIKQLDNLRKLHLMYNELSALPKELFNLKKLTHLYLKGNSITALPIEIEKLKNLEHLNIRFNEITSLPNHITKLSRLTTLILGGNSIEKLPNKIEEINSLKYMNIRKLPLSQSEVERLKENKNISILYDESVKEEIINTATLILEISRNDFSKIKNQIENGLANTQSDENSQVELSIKPDKNIIAFSIKDDPNGEVSDTVTQFIDNLFQVQYTKPQDPQDVLKSKILKLIQENKLPEALEKLAEFFKEKNIDLYYEIIQHIASLKKFKQSVRKEQISYKDLIDEQKRIQNNILDIIDEI